MNKAPVLAAMLSLFGTQAFAEAESRFSHPFENQYEIIDNSGKTVGSERDVCDGKGHFRTEMNTPSEKFTEIIDFPKKTVTGINLLDKNFMTSALTQYEEDTQNLKQPAGSKPLGTKSIDGHSCKGFEHTISGNTSTIWIDDSIRAYVLLEIASKDGKVTFKLKSHSDKAPTEEITKVPAGYKEITAPAKDKSPTK